jgi:hypothetical protein
MAVRMAVRDALGSLTCRQRAVRVRRVADDLSGAPSAHLLGCRLGAVNSAIFLRGDRGDACMDVPIGRSPDTTCVSAFGGLEERDNVKQTRLTWAVAGGVLALGIGVLMALPAAMSAAAAPPPIKHFRVGPALYDVGVHAGMTPAQARALAGRTVPEYTAKVKVGTRTFVYTMVGKNPAIKSASPATTVKAEIVPLVMKFPDGDAWNPAKIDSCDRGASALARTQKSPVVVPQAWKFGPTPIGTGQYVDAFQRAEFWKFAKPGGINPAFGVSLAVKTLKPVTINVPTAWGPATTAIGCGNGLLGAVNFDQFYTFLHNTLIPRLQSQGVGAKTFAIFVLHNFVEYIDAPDQCCVLGFHDTDGPQTFALATYDNSGAFAGASDITALSHEVAEWQNDPEVVNPTPPWGHIGQVVGCDPLLEVGDPLSGTMVNDTVGGFTYHPQELAFFSWFYHQKPSLGANGWYSSNGTFKAFAAHCA